MSSPKFPLEDRPMGTKSPHYSEIMQTPSKASQLSLSRSITPANVGRRRMYTATSLLQSPARQGHRSRMAAFFQNAAASLERTRSDSNVSKKFDQENVQSEAPRLDGHRSDSADVCYPALPSSPAPLTPFVHRNSLHITTPSNANGHTMNERKANGSKFPQSCETAKPSNMYHFLGRSANPLFEWNSPSTSASSPSWTGDAEFFRPQPQQYEVSPYEENDIVSKWIERLPDTPEGHEDSDCEEIEPLSPSVELERGSMRRRRREWERQDRQSYGSWTCCRCAYGDSDAEWGRNTCLDCGHERCNECEDASYDN